LYTRGTGYQLGAWNCYIVPVNKVWYWLVYMHFEKRMAKILDEHLKAGKSYKAVLFNVIIHLKIGFILGAQP